MKKILSFALIICILFCSGCSSSGFGKSGDSSSYESSAEETERSTRIKNITNKYTSSISIRRDTSETIEFDFKSDGVIEDEDIEVVIDDESIIEPGKIKIHNILDYIEVKINAVAFGTTKLHLESADGTVKSADITINVPVEIEKAEIQGKDSVDLIVGKSCKASVKIKPKHISQDDINVVSSDNDYVTVKNVKYKKDKDCLVVSFEITGVAQSYGEYVDIKNSFDESVAKIKINVEEEETEPPTTEQPTTKEVKKTVVETDPPVNQAYNDYEDDYEDNHAVSSSNYILNTNTKKFHIPTCSSVNRMSEKNKQEFYGSRDDAIAMGYSPCQRCNP